MSATSPRRSARRTAAGTTSAKEAVVVNGKWKAIPFGNIGQLMNWRTDWFAEVGVKKFPDTWDELLEAGIKLKKAGHPFGFELGHGFGDNHGWLYPLLWSYGGARGRGRTARPSSSIPTRPRGPSISAASSSRRPCSRTASAGPTSATTRPGCREQISCTNNAESILWFAKKRVSRHRQGHRPGAEPAGAEGALPHARTRGAMRSSASRQNQQAAKDFLRWLMDAEAGRRWYDLGRHLLPPFLHAYDNAPMWNVEPRNLPYRDALQDVASAGLAGAARPAAVGERRQIRRRRHVRQGLRRQVDQGGDRRRRRAAQADLQVGLSVSADTRSLARPAVRAARPPLRARGAGLEREGVFSWLMVAPPVAVPGGAGRLSVLLRHLAQPAGPAGRQARHVRRPGQFHHRLRTTRCSGRWRSNTFI